MTKYVDTVNVNEVAIVVDGMVGHVINPACDEWPSYVAFIASGGVAMSPPPTKYHELANDAWLLSDMGLAELVRDLVLTCETAVNELLQAEVDAYNKDNGTIFADVHSCGNYRHDVGYTHQPFCAAVWSWNVAVWERCREVQTAGALMTVEELLASLPELQWPAV